MSNPRTLPGGWVEYLAEIYPDGVNDFLNARLQDAYYAGAGVVLDSVGTFGEGVELHERSLELDLYINEVDAQLDTAEAEAGAND